MINSNLIINCEAGTELMIIDKVTYRKNDKVRLRLGKRRSDVSDMLLDDRIATIEAIHTDNDGKVYIAVTMDDDPAQNILRQMKIYRFFLPDEVTVLKY